MRDSGPVSVAAWCAAAAALFLNFAGDGLSAYFTPDDMMNLYLAWTRPFEGRLAGTWFYRAMFFLFGLDPFPYRVACMALIALNLALLFPFVRLLTGSRAAAAAACLLGAYHAHLADIYYSTGTIYDLLCGAFWQGAFICHVSVRARGGRPGWGRTALETVLFVGAMASKETAVLLPAFIALYEVLYHRLEAGWARWRFVLVAAPLAAAYVVWKLTGPEKMAANPAYAMTFTYKVWSENWRIYLENLFYGVKFSAAGVVAVWAALLAAALASKRKALLFAWCLMFFGAAPVLFIAQRGLYALYVALPGWWLYGAALYDMLPGRGRWRDWAGLVALTAALVPLHAWRKPLGKGWVEDAFAQVRTMREELRAGYPSMPPGARVLFRSDTYPEDDWILTFIFRLHYGDPEIRVDRLRQVGAKPGPPESYTHVFSFRDGRLMREGP